jgi:hypothetical protein
MEFYKITSDNELIPNIILPGLIIQGMIAAGQGENNYLAS